MSAPHTCKLNHSTLEDKYKTDDPDSKYQAQMYTHKNINKKVANMGRQAHTWRDYHECADTSWSDADNCAKYYKSLMQFLIRLRRYAENNAWDLLEQYSLNHQLQNISVLFGCFCPGWQYEG